VKSRRALERLLSRFDKDESLRAELETRPQNVADRFGLAPDELAAVLERNVVQLYHWGVHALLIRNFAGFNGIDLATAYRDAGLVKDVAASP
jgi:Aromatic-ring-opening dioxygenase LigAB, LigA subunit